MSIEPGDPSLVKMGSVMIAIGADCAVLYFRATEPMDTAELTLFVGFHTALAGLSFWQYSFDAAEKATYHRTMLPHRTSMAGYGPPYVMGGEEFEKMKLALGSRLQVQLETRQAIARPGHAEGMTPGHAECMTPGPAEGMAWFVNEIGGVVTANRDIAKLQRRLRVVGKVFTTDTAKGEDGEHSRMIEDEHVQYARLPETLLSARNAVLLRYMGLNFSALAAVMKRVTTGGGTTGGGITGGDIPGGDIPGGDIAADVARRRDMRARLLAAEACVTRHQYEGGELWKAVTERDEALAGAAVAKQALVYLKKGHQKRANQRFELETILGKQRLERQNIKQEGKRLTELAEEVGKDADVEEGIAECHEETLKLFRQDEESRKRDFQDDHVALEDQISKIQDPGGRHLRQKVVDLEREKIQLQGELKELTSVTKEMTCLIKNLEMKRKQEQQRRRLPKAKLESASTKERPNPARTQHPTQERFESSGPTRRGGGGGRRAGSRGLPRPTCGQNPTVKLGAARSRGAACNDQIGKLLTRSPPVEYYSKQ